MRPLENRQVDVIRFNYLTMDSSLYQLVESRPRSFNRDRFPVVSTHWRMAVPPTIDDFYKSRSSKHRSWLRRMERVLLRDYPEAIRYHLVKNENELDCLFVDVEKIARKTYQRNIRVGFTDNEETRKTYAFLSRKGRLRAYLTYIRDEPKAFWIGELYRDTFTLFSTGYDPVYKKYELGTVLFLKMLEDLCALKTVRHLDFGFGDASYKSRFGDQSWQEATINIFSNNFNGIKANMARLLIVGGQRGALKVLKKMALLEKLKKGWRNK
jgi:hypothetical protein